MLPMKQFDDNFWDWYEKIGPSWLMTHRKDILDEMYKAYQDTISVEVDENVTFAALKSETMQAMAEMMNLLSAPEEKKSITDSEIKDFEKKLKKRIRISWEEE